MQYPLLLSDFKKTYTNITLSQIDQCLTSGADGCWFVFDLLDIFANDMTHVYLARYGNSLVLVASQTVRWRTIIGEMSDPNYLLTDVQYCVIERIARYYLIYFV